MCNSRLLEKWFPLQSELAHSLYFFKRLEFSKQNRKEEEEEGETEQQQLISINPRL